MGTLEPILGNLADSLGRVAYIQYDSRLTTDEVKLGKYASIWVLMAAKQEPLEPFLKSGKWQVCRKQPSLGIWTDDQSNLLSVIRWKK